MANSQLMRRLESDTTFDNVSATGRIWNRLAIRIPQYPALAGLLASRNAFDGRYSNVENRLARFQIGCGPE